MKIESDSLRRFMVGDANVRGEWVHLDTAWREIVARGEYPDSVKTLLGHAVAAIALLSATIKYDGSLILQIKGNGPIHLLVVQATSDGKMRGLARWDHDTVSTESLEGLGFNELLGEGHLVITVQPNGDGERYQGIVALEGDSLSECIGGYFQQSEQLPTKLWLSADGAAAAGLLLQRLPGEAGDEDGWDRLVMLSDTITDVELLGLDVATTLTRLFHQESLELFESNSIVFECSCSMDKINRTVQALGKEEAMQLLEEQEVITVDCDFCNARYTLDVVDVEGLFHPAAQVNTTQH